MNLRKKKMTRKKINESSQSDENNVGHESEIIQEEQNDVEKDLDNNETVISKNAEG